jgi:fatty-acyl-CoA synthase
LNQGIAVPDWLARRAVLSPDKTALIDTLNGSRPITYHQWNEQVNRTAHFLHDEIGVRPGDHISILAKNCVEYLDIWFALSKIGAVLHNLNWRLAARELCSLLQDAKPTALIYDNLLPDANEIRLTVQTLRETLAQETIFISLGEPLSRKDFQFYNRENHPQTPLPDPRLLSHDIWTICYTGGTTGTPKGAMLSYAAITSNAINTIISWGLKPDDITILNSPLFHTGGLNVLTAPLVYLGGTSIVCRGFDLEQTFELLGNGSVTVWFGVPTMFIMMQSHPLWESIDFSKVRILISGGAPCPTSVFTRFFEKGVNFKTGYGLTEAGPNTFWLPDNQVHSKVGAVGYPLFHVDVRIVDESGQDLDSGNVGELLIRGPHTFSGYWNNAQATAEVTLDGWLHTGDLASCDSDGCYKIVGRLKDMIISGGENIYPAEIENVLYEHPAVCEAALIGVPDDKWGEVGWAIVVLHQDCQVSQDDLFAHCQKNLARYKLPKRIIFTDMLPKTGANKVDKKGLINQYAKS